MDGWLLDDEAVRLTLLNEFWEEGLKNWIASKVTVAMVEDFQSRQGSTVGQLQNNLSSGTEGYIVA